MLRCLHRESETKEYAERVEEALRFLKGDTREILRSMEAQMQQAAEDMDFERAATLRDRIRAIQRMQDKQKSFSSPWKNRTFFYGGVGKHRLPCRASFFRRAAV